MLLCGRFRILLLYDVAEAIDLKALREILGLRGEGVKREFPRRTPEYVRSENPPVVEPLDPMVLGTGERLSCSLHYYAYAVAGMQLEAPFEGDWPSLLSQASRWIDAPEVESRARELVRKRLERISSLITRSRPVDQWLQESYLVINLEEIRSAQSNRPTAAELLSAHGAEIAQLIRGEVTPLAPRISEETVQGAVSYYPSDLVVAGSSAALVYDRAEDALATTQVLEYAKMQLLEFRYYDGLMTRLLSEAYDALEEKRNVLLSRWKLPRRAQGLNAIRLDVMELTERIDNAIKFVSDIYYAHVYRLAATRMGVPDYRDLVDEKLRAMGRLYEFMVDQFNESRSFVLELGIAILALLDVILLIKGK
jgi:hypothetical protein